MTGTSDKSKETIMREEYSSRIMNWEKAYAQQPAIFSAAHAAMQRYADQENKNESIAYQNFVRSQGFIKKNGRYYSRYVKGITLTDDGLYNLYRKSLTITSIDQKGKINLEIAID